MKKVAALGLKAAGMKKSELEKHLAPLVKAGKITSKEAKSLAGDLIAVGKKHHKIVHNAVKKQVEKELKARGYVKAKSKLKRKAAAKKSTVKKKAAKKKAVKRKTVKKKAKKKRK